MKKTIAAVLAMIMLLTACGIAGAEQAPRKMETAADADEFVAALLGEHPEKLEGEWVFSAQMEAALAQKNWKANGRFPPKCRQCLLRWAESPNWQRRLLCRALRNLSCLRMRVNCRT